MILTSSALKEKESELMKLKIRLDNIRKEKHLSFSQADGDGWHDNFGYEQAVRDEKMIINEINSLSELIRTATVLENSRSNQGQVSIDSNVLLKLDYGDGDVEELSGRLVALNTKSLEHENEITLNSPIGQAIFGKSSDDESECILPNGNVLKIKVMSIW